MRPIRTIYNKENNSSSEIYRRTDFRLKRHRCNPHPSLFTGEHPAEADTKMEAGFVLKNGVCLFFLLQGLPGSDKVRREAAPSKFISDRHTDVRLVYLRLEVHRAVIGRALAQDNSPASGSSLIRAQLCHRN